MEFNLVIFLLNCVLVIGFLSAAAAYGLLFFKRTLENRDELVKVSRRILFLIITVQLIYFILRTLTYEHAPITSLFELTGLVAFGVTIAYRYIEFRTKVYETGFFVVAAAAVFQITSVVFISENSEVNPVLKSGLLGVHVSAALVGYSAIIISGIYGFLYLMLYKQLKQSRLNNFYKKLPSLQLLQQLTDSAIQFGFFFLTLTVLIGIVWLP